MVNTDFDQGQPPGIMQADLIRRIMETSPVGIVVVNRAGQIEFANAEAEQVLGLVCDGKAQRSYNAPEWHAVDYEGNSIPEADLPFNRVLKTKAAVRDVRLAIEWPNGQRKLLSINSSPLMDESGQVDRVVAAIEEVTQRVETVKSLRSSEERYRQLFESVNDAIFLRPIAQEGSWKPFAEVNGVACRWLGYTREELRKKTLFDIDTDVTPEKIEAWEKQVLAQGGAIFQTRFRTKDGVRMPVEISSHILDWEGQQMMLSIARDLTERHAAEAVLRESERRFRDMMENVRLIAIMLDAEGKILFANQFLLHLTGWTADEVMGQQWVELFIPPDESAKMKDVYGALIARNVVPHHENDIITRRGERRRIAWSNTVLRGANGKSIGDASIGEDITDRHRAQEDLRRSEENYRSIFENAPVGIYQSTTDRLITVNPALAAMFGYKTPEEMVARGASPADFFVKADLRRQILEEVVKSGALTQQEVEYRRKDGSTFVANLCMRAVHDPLGKVKMFEGFVENITERKQAEDRLRESEMKFRQLAENIDRVFWICDKDKTELLYVSPAYEKVWGRSCQGLYAEPWSFTDAIHPGDRDRLLASLERQSHGESYEEEYRIVRPDGSVRWIHDRSFTVRNEKGEFYRIAGLAEDITERKQLEEQLRQSQKMEGIGQLAGGIAHDFNNIIAATLMHLGWLQESRHLTLGTKRSLKEVENEINRAANLTRQLLLFSRRQVARFQPLEMNALVNELLKMLRRLLGENIDVAFQSFARAVWVKADAGMLEQVIMNLCINARDAMPKGGRLILSTMVVECDSRSLQQHPDARRGHYVCLIVTDTGCGMDETVMKRMFEPFFTTKEVGKGTGLGLATVYGIVKQHDGWVESESTVGQGTTFRVYLPVIENTVEMLSSAAHQQALSGGTETILLVEDDQSLRWAMAVFLRKLGYGVVEAPNGTEALRVWAQQREEIDLLLTDMVMPEFTTGLQLAERLKSDKPALKIILCSGYSAEFAKPVPTDAEITFLAKPFNPSDLAMTVRKCFEKP